MKKPISAADMEFSEVVSSFVTVARPIILKFMKANSCIASSRIALECMKYFGIEAYAIPVTMFVKFPEKNVAYCCGMSKEEKAKAKHAANFLDCQSTVDDWDGHVIILAHSSTGSRFLLDPSFDQVSVSGVEFPPTVLAIPIESDVPDGLLQVSLSFKLDDGQPMEVGYFPLEDNSYTLTPAWEFDLFMQVIVSGICGRMESLMGLERDCEIE